MNIFKITKVFIFLLSMSFLTLIILRNYNSPENIEKRCLLKFEKDFKIPLETSREEWVRVLDLADKNYLKCMSIPQY